MKRILIFSFMFLSTIKPFAYTGVYVGWQNFISPVLPIETTADSLTFGVIGTTPTRVYFYYNILAHFIMISGAVQGNLGWGMDISGGLGYRFLNTAHKKSGWDLGIDIYGYFTPYFLNSDTSFTETALYYGVGLGINTVYKINPYIGLGVRASLKYNIGFNYLATKQESTPGLMFTVGTFLTF